MNDVLIYLSRGMLKLEISDALFVINKLAFAILLLDAYSTLHLSNYLKRAILTKLILGVLES